MGELVSVVLNALGQGTLTLECTTSAYPHLGRRIEREIDEHVFRDAGATSPEDAATKLLVARPYTVVDEPLTLAIPFATEAVVEWFQTAATSLEAKATITEPFFGSRTFVLGSANFSPRTDVHGRVDITVELRRTA